MIDAVSDRKNNNIHDITDALQLSALQQRIESINSLAAEIETYCERHPEATCREVGRLVATALGTASNAQGLD